jgi:NAD(P)-dependent dehydrogenase (short-subunit alcohol dehydrogenase family)
MQSFKGKVAVVTGGGSGMGRELSLQLAAAGAVVAVVDISDVRAKETVELIARSGGKAAPYVVDISDKEQVAALARSVDGDHGPAQILVNNAGILMKSERFDAMAVGDVQRLLDINLGGVVACTTAFLPQLLSHGQAALVNVSSLGGLVGLMKQVPYAAAKFAVRGFSEALRMDLYETGLKITVVYPGPVATNIFINSPQLTPEEGLAGQDSMQSVRPVPADKAASQILRAVRKGKARVIIGRAAKAMDILARLFPNAYTKLLFKPVKKMMDATV